MWTAVGTTAATELRYSDLSTQGAVASASWPFITRPASTSGVAYLYVATADATLLGYLGTSSATPIAYANSNYRCTRWDWDNTGTFASAPIFTAYASTGHAAISRGDNSLLGGNTTDTGATARSYFKGNAFGRVDSGGAPAAAPANAPVVTDGATGALTPTAGANWLTNYQGLQGDNDYIQFPSTPAATTADDWSTEIAMFIGPGLTPGTLTPVASLKYSWT